MNDRGRMLAWAYYMAAQVHRNQIGKDGRPYFEHVYEVGRRAGEQYDKLGVYLPIERESVQSLAVLHDALEDMNEENSLSAALLAGSIKELLGPELHGDLRVLTRDPDEDYLGEYIPRVARHSWRTRLVKLCDLSHNLEAFRMPEGVPLDRYLKSRVKYNTAFEYLLRFDDQGGSS